MRVAKKNSEIVLCLFVLSLFLLSSFVLSSFQPMSASTRLLSSSVSSSDASGDPIIEYQIPTPNAGPNAVVAGSNNTLWFVEFIAGKIGEFFIGNYSFREFVIPEANATPASLAIDRFGNIWFSDQHGSGSIWMLNPATGKFRQFPTLTHDSTPLFITFDKQNDVWFTEITGNNIGELSYPTYSETEYPLPTPTSGPVEIAYQENESKLWITQTYSNQLSSFNITTHAFNEFNPTVSMNSPVGIVLDKNGDVWISEHRGSAIIEFNPSDSFWRKFLTTVPPPNAPYPISAPATLAIASNGDLWFVEHFSNKIGRLDPSTGTLQEFAIPNSDAYSVLNAIDSNGNFWFTQFAADALGFVPANASSPISVQVIDGGSTPTVKAGGRIYLNVSVTNNGPMVMPIQLNVSSSFSSTGYTPSNEAAFVENPLVLDNGSTADISVETAPPNSLSTGTYSVGIVLSTGNYSVVQTIFIIVHGNPYLFLPRIQIYLEIILGGAVVAFGGFYFLVVKKSVKKSPST